MRRMFPTLTLIAIAIVTAAAQTAKPSALDWHDSTRDVYIDGEIDRAAQVLVCDSPSRIAVISGRLGRAIVLDVPQNAVSTMAKDTFHLSSDRSTATSEGDAVSQPSGKFTRIDGPVYVFVADGKTVLIRQHPGVTGELTLDKLWQTVPVWRALMESYNSDAAAVSQLKRCGADTTVTLLFGTWCPDSKKYVPKLLKALRDANNDHLRLTLVGIDNQFREPVDTVQPKRIINVPTVIVERDGREIGRIIETPAGSTIEQDLAAILNGKPLVHNGRWERGKRLAEGAYEYRDANGKKTGAEQWELFETSEGGRLAHSRISVGEDSTEVFHRVNAKRQTTFVEITKRRGDAVMRSRYNIDGRAMTLRVRGNVSGVIQQTIDVPEGVPFVSPAVATAGWALPDERDNRNHAATYFAPTEFQGTAGTLNRSGYEAKGTAPVRVSAGEFTARHALCTTGASTADWWLHPTLGIPFRGKIAGGAEYALIYLKTE
ncbi:MAG TPA: thioredoxin family protein [Blastocatellia bacterium]|nr:thioredoxin family protein [Blastocatellia bacterium]